MSRYGGSVKTGKGGDKSWLSFMGKFLEGVKNCGSVYGIFGDLVIVVGGICAFECLLVIL